MPRKTDLKKLSQMIIETLAEDEESRNDDKRLTFKVLKKILPENGQSQLLVITSRQLKRLPAFSTITRIRALIQNTLHQYLPTRPSVRIQRNISEQTWRQYVTGTPVFPEMRG